MARVCGRRGLFRFFLPLPSSPGRSPASPGRRLGITISGRGGNESSPRSLGWSYSLGHLSLIFCFPRVFEFLLVAVLILGMSRIGWNGISLIVLGETVGKESLDLATATGFFFRIMDSLICPPLFGYVVNMTGAHGYGLLFLTFCATVILFPLSRFPQRN